MAADDELEPTTTEPAENTDLDEQVEPADDVEFTQPPLDDDDELPPATDDDEPTDDPPAPPEGVTVDEKGRWRNPDGTFASKQPTKEAEQSVKQETEAAKNDRAASSVSDPVVPWKPNIYGNEVELIPGAKFHPEHGLLIPVAQIPNATALMARGTKYDEVKQERQRFAQEKDSILAPARFENEQMAGILQRTALNPEWVLQAATDPEWAKKELTLMLREAQIGLKEKYGNSVLAQPTPDGKPTADPGDLDPYDAELGLRGWLNDTLTTADYHGLFSPQDTDAIVRRLMAIQPFAKHEGQWALDTLVATQMLDALAEAPRRDKARMAEEEKRKAADAATKRNAAVVPKPTDTTAKKTAKKTKSTPSTNKAWDDPKLSREEKRELLRKSVLGT